MPSAEAPGGGDSRGLRLGERSSAVGTRAPMGKAGGPWPRPPRQDSGRVRVGGALPRHAGTQTPTSSLQDPEKESLPFITHRVSVVGWPPARTETEPWWSLRRATGVAAGQLDVRSCSPWLRHVGNTAQI